MKYFWSVVFGLAEISVAAYVISEVTYSDSTVIAALIVVYAAVRSAAISNSLMMNKFVLGVAADVTRIRAEISGKEDSYETEMIKLAAEKTNTNENILLIRGFAVGIVFLIGLLNL